MVSNRVLKDHEFKDRIASIHGNDIVCLEAYRGHTKIPHQFKHNGCGHVWFTKPCYIFYGSGCPKCHNTAKRTADSFDADLVEDGRGLIRIGPYTNRSTKTLLRCFEGHTWNVQPSMIKHRNCPQCVRRNHKFLYSRKAVEFIELVATSARIKFQHAENGGEYKVMLDGKLYSVDGYNKRLRLILEFHGDSFHGNPKRFAANDNCHPYRKHVTAGELLAATRTKERKLRKLGYKVISVWESDYNRNPRSCADACVEFIMLAKEHKHLEKMGYGLPRKR